MVKNLRVHTCEHILNQVLIKMFNCSRSYKTHFSDNKGKCDYHLIEEPSDISLIEKEVNIMIKKNLPINIKFLDRKDISDDIDLRKLPEGVKKNIRIVSIGEFDSCPCIGEHVKNTSEIGVFKITSSNFKDGKLRINFKLE